MQSQDGYGIWVKLILATRGVACNALARSTIETRISRDNNFVATRICSVWGHRLESQVSQRRITETSQTIPNRTAIINRATAVPRASALGSGGGGGIFMLLLVRCGKPTCPPERTSNRPVYDLFNVTRTHAPDCVSTSSIRPPCASTSDLEIAKPKPLPPRCRPRSGLR